MDQILSHLLVVELASLETEWCGRLFSQAGARVILVEPPSGSETRLFAPFFHGQNDPERSLQFWHYNTDKESVTADLATANGRELLAALISRADVFLEATAPGELDKRGLAWTVLLASNPRLVQVSISDFGQDGPQSQDQASDLVHQALGGQMKMNGYDDQPGSPPIAGAVNHAYHMGGTSAFVAALARLQCVDSHGGGFVDVSIHEAAAGMTEIALPQYDYTGGVVRRQTGRHASLTPTPRTQFRARDGRYVNARLLHMSPATWTALIEWMEESGMAEDLAEPEYYIPEVFQSKSFHVYDVLGRFIATKTADEIFYLGQEKGLVFCDVNYPEDLVSDEQLEARGFWRELDFGTDIGSLRVPGSAFVCTPGDIAPRTGAPHIGEHEAAVREWLAG